MLKKIFCHIHYVNGENNQSKNYYFVPQKLIAMNNALYVYGAIPNNVATELVHTICLVLHRIKKLDLIKQLVSVPEPKENTFGLPWHEPRTFSIQCTKEAAGYVRERVWADEQIRK